MNVKLNMVYRKAYKNHGTTVFSVPSKKATITKTRAKISYQEVGDPHDASS